MMIRWHLNYRLVKWLLAVGLLATVLILASFGCVTTIVPPIKLLPAYTLDIKYPSEEGSVVYVERGGSVTLQVTVRSLVDEPIKIRLNLTAPTSVPAFVQFMTDEEYRTIEPGDTISTEMTITVSENAPLGSIRLSMGCDLYEPVEERGGLSMGFTLTVTDG